MKVQILDIEGLSNYDIRRNQTFNGSSLMEKI